MKRRFLIPAAVLAVVLPTASAGAQNDRPIVVPRFPQDPQGAVQDLAAAFDGESILLTWTAPVIGNGGDPERLYYEFCYSTVAPIDDETWFVSTFLPGLEPVYPDDGTTLMRVAFPPPTVIAVNYWFALRYMDDSQSWSAVSNSALLGPGDPTPSPSPSPSPSPDPLTLEDERPGSGGGACGARGSGRLPLCAAISLVSAWLLQRSCRLSMWHS